MNRLDSKIREQLMNLIGGPSQDELDVDEILSLMLQISFALMMIFMIAFFLFRAKVGTELDKVENLRQNQLIGLQRQRLIIAQNRQEEYAKIRYGLRAFAVSDSKHNILYRAAKVISNGHLTGNPTLRQAFIRGSSAAFKDFSRPEQLVTEWQKAILARANLRLNDLAPANRAWLRQRIKESLNSLRCACEDVQSQAAAAVQDYFIRHPDKVDDPAIRHLLQQFSRAAEAEQKLLIPELNRLLRQHAFNYLRQQTGTPMLETLP